MRAPFTGQVYGEQTPIRSRAVRMLTFLQKWQSEFMHKRQCFTTWALSSGLPDPRYGSQAGRFRRVGRPLTAGY